MKPSWNCWRRYRKRPSNSEEWVTSPAFSGGAVRLLLDDPHQLDERLLSALSTQHFPELAFFRINDMEPCRMTGRQQLCVGTDDGQPQGLELQRQRQV